MTESESAKRNIFTDGFWIRCFLLVICFSLFVWLALQYPHGCSKGLYFNPWLLIPTTIVATAFGIIGKRLLNFVACIGLAGIGGAIGCMDQLSSQYAGVLGVSVGCIVALLPFFRRPKHHRPGRDGGLHD